MTVINSKKAFSVMEIMVTVSIVAILSTTAIIIYPKYKAKTEVSMAIKALEAYSLAAQNYYTENSFLPSNINAINSGTTAPNEISLTNTNDVISLNYTFPNTAPNSLKNQTISLELKLNNSIFSSTCLASVNFEQQYLPSNCTIDVSLINNATTDALTLLAIVETTIKGYYGYYHIMPSSLREMQRNMPVITQSTYKDMTMNYQNNTTITLSYNFINYGINALDGKSLMYKIQRNSDNTFTITCSSSTIDPKYLPLQCK